MPDEIPGAIQATGRHVMGGIHAVEHAALSLFPLFALCDRHDVAGISYVRHPQVGLPAIFFYDQHAGGVGLAPSVFERIETLLETTLELIRDCPCQEGCPACVHSPRCGSGNRPIDKEASVRVLELLAGHDALPPVERRAAGPPPRPDRRTAGFSADTPPPRLLVFDLETQRSADEVGGWHNAHLMRISLAVIHDSLEQRFTTFFEADVKRLLERLACADLVIGFNVRRFDYQVLRGYTDDDLSALPTFDLLDEIHARLGFRVSLAHLGEETLGASKSADGLQALAWWKEGRIDEIEEYCRRDVALVRDLFEHARKHGHLLFRSRRGGRVRIPMQLSVDELLEKARAGRDGGAPAR
jgi:DEAD/DEAH box helicase domain-containing protein